MNIEITTGTQVFSQGDISLKEYEICNDVERLLKEIDKDIKEIKFRQKFGYRY